MEQLTVVRTIWIQASRERVWAAVTEAEQLSRWYSPGSPWEIPSLKVEAVVLFHHSPNRYHSGMEVVTLRATIETVDPLHRFAVRWEYEESDVDMVTTFILTEENGGTKVTITETGYETQQQLKQTEEGYGMSLENLKAHMEGRELPY
ncbi:SRPBCC domain-containing protein [Paenibacillus contaminans]|uniref:Activator of Hsp90 ATPase homologue 1/2-like C-terminal domain-containing protein n=1 Tax=Paenibacillus contaminans TaxID=450362 RepID=A0A329M788_9BACL|nr:SRPBCC domain-containing protein [Paenibacillus contaminans]RAV15598.1 hypothetical protein DQG23_29935 [Paenibacillus contaminans]